MAETLKTGTEGIAVGGTEHVAPAGSVVNGEPGLPKGSSRQLNEVSYVPVQGSTHRGGGSQDKAARARADTYAEAAGLTVVRVLRIRDGARPEEPHVLAEAMDVAAPQAVAAPPPVMAGTNESTVTVNVDFALGPK